jgi:hypothetical protein
MPFNPGAFLREDRVKQGNTASRYLERGAARVDDTFNRAARFLMRVSLVLKHQARCRVEQAMIAICWGAGRAAKRARTPTR